MRYTPGRSGSPNPSSFLCSIRRSSLLAASCRARAQSRHPTWNKHSCSNLTDTTVFCLFLFLFPSFPFFLSFFLSFVLETQCHNSQLRASNALQRSGTTQLPIRLSDFSTQAQTGTIQYSPNFNLRLANMNFNLRTLDIQLPTSSPFALPWNFNLRLNPRAPTFRIQPRTLTPWYRDVEFNFQSTLLNFGFLLDFQFNQPPCSIRSSASSSAVSGQHRDRDN
jgi:hypothetical protein